MEHVMTLLRQARDMLRAHPPRGRSPDGAHTWCSECSGQVYYGGPARGVVTECKDDCEYRRLLAEIDVVLPQSVGALEVTA